jgi:hypothetical protein
VVSPISCSLIRLAHQFFIKPFTNFSIILYHSLCQASSLFTPKTAYAQPAFASDILWDKIVSIKAIGYEHVYDIEVQGTHNFIGNGIVAHNTFLNAPAATEQQAAAEPAPATGRAAASIGRANAVAESRISSVLILTDNMPEAQQRMSEIIPASAMGRVSVTYEEVDGSLSQLSGLPAKASGFDKVVLYFTDSNMAASVAANLTGMPPHKLIDISDEKQQAEFTSVLATGL